MTLYAAYGANLDPALMGLLAPHSRAARQRLAGRLAAGTFGGEEHGWEGPLTTVVEDPDHQVFVALYDVSPQDEHSMDGWEGTEIGIYSKIRVRVATLEGDELAWLYVVDGYEGGLPSAGVLRQIAEAAEKAGAPDDYVRDLRARPCRSKT